MSDEDTDENGEFVERLQDDGRHTGVIVIAPHGGDIEVHTDDQAQRVAGCLADTAASVWLRTGYHPRGAEITGNHVRRHPSRKLSLAQLAIVPPGHRRGRLPRFERDEILVAGGTAASALKKEITSAIEKKVVGSDIPVRVAGPDDPIVGDDRYNIVNRPTVGGRMTSRSSRAGRREPSIETTSPKRWRVSLRASPSSSVARIVVGSGIVRRS